MRERGDAVVVVHEHDVVLTDEFGGALADRDRPAAVDAGEVTETVSARLLERGFGAAGEHVLHRRDVEGLVGVTIGRTRQVGERHRLPSWATFSSRVSSRSSASTRSLVSSATSCHGRAGVSAAGSRVVMDVPSRRRRALVASKHFETGRGAEPSAICSNEPGLYKDSAATLALRTVFWQDP